MFLAGDLVVGAGAGLMFKGAIATVAEISSASTAPRRSPACSSPPTSGLPRPVIGLGAVTQFASTRVSLLVFAGMLALAILAATPALLGRRPRHPSSQPQPASN